MKWINFYQNQFDKVIYITDDDLDNTYVKKYEDFVTWLNVFASMRFKGKLVEELNKFKIISYNIVEDVYEIVNVSDTEGDTTFEELYLLNKPLVEECKSPSIAMNINDYSSKAPNNSFFKHGGVNDFKNRYFK